MQFAIAVLVFVVVSLAAFAALSLFDERSAQARLLRDRLSQRTESGRTASPGRGPAARRMLSRIPAFDTLLRRSERVSLCRRSCRRDT